MKRLYLLLTLCVLSLVSCDKLFPDEPETTTFTITHNTTYNVISIGSDIAVNYRITKPIEGVNIVATPSEEWITESKSLDSAIIFTVDKNDTDASRSATITLVYNDIEHTVTINQGAAGSEAEEYTKFEHLSGHYLGTRYGSTEGGNNYYLILGDSGNCRDMASGDLNLVKGNKYLFIELFSATAPERLNLEFNVPAGNYAFDHSNSATIGTIAELPTYLYYEDGKEGVMTEFVNGSVTITESCIYANFVDQNGKEYKYYCPTTYIDNASTFGPVNTPENLSTLKGDINITFSDLESYISCYGDRYLIGKNYWDIFLIDNATGDCLSLILLSNTDNKIPTGLFQISTDLSIDNIALPGYANCEGIQVWSWYTLFTDDRTILGQAPIVGGEINIEENGDTTYTVTIDVVDDIGNRITGSCTTAITEQN